MDMKIVITILAVLSSTILLSQKKGYSEDLSTSRILYTDSINRVVTVSPDSNSDQSSADSTEEAVIHADVSREIDSIINKISDYNEAHHRKIRGFRVQIYNGRSESAAQTALEEAKTVIGRDLFAETTWQAPVFRTRIGCFSNRLEAFKVYLSLQEIFPNALIVPDYGLSAECIK